MRPVGRSRSIPSTARIAPNCFTSPRASTAGAPPGGLASGEAAVAAGVVDMTFILVGMSSPRDEEPTAGGDEVAGAGAGGDAGEARGRPARPGRRDTRAAILDAAAAELAATGRLSVNAVAARAGVS